MLKVEVTGTSHLRLHFSCNVHKFRDTLRLMGRRPVPSLHATDCLVLCLNNETEMAILVW